MPAQTATSTPPSEDSKSLLLAAADANGAPSPDAKPWHAKISFSISDWDGKVESQGSVEEFWAGPSKFKLVYATPNFNQVEYTTAAGIRRSGSHDNAPPEIARIIDQFFQPIRVSAADIDSTTLKQSELTMGTMKLACVTMEAGRPADSKPGPAGTYCMSGTAPILRLTVAPGGYQRTVRNNIVKFQGRYFPRQIERVMEGPGEQSPVRTQFTAKLDAIDLLDPVDESQFEPPADAGPPPQVIVLDEKATKQKLLQHPPPVYPPIAKAARVSGDVGISLQVQTDGRVSKLRVVSGPAMLQQAALDAVKKWTFAPFELNGTPVEVNTTVTVTFRLL